jgi:hypothetical protein
MTKAQEASVRAALAGIDPLWVEEAIAKVREMTDVDEISVTVVASIQVRVHGYAAETAALQAENKQRAAALAMEQCDDHGIVH